MPVGHAYRSDRGTDPAQIGPGGKLKDAETGVGGALGEALIGLTPRLLVLFWYWLFNYFFFQSDAHPNGAGCNFWCAVRALSVATAPCG